MRQLTRLALPTMIVSMATACGSPSDLSPDGAFDPGGAVDGDPAAIGAAPGPSLDAAPATLVVRGRCEVMRAPRIFGISASAAGLAVVSAGGEVNVLAGQACDVVDTGVSIVASSFFGIDDDGGLYFRGEGPMDTIVRRLGDGSPDEVVLSAGRGIWSFGVSADGSHFYSTACGPTGVFARGDASYAASMPTPEGAWHEAGGVLTGAGDVFFTRDHENRLLRADQDGSRVVDGVDVTDGVLGRCGDAVCIADSEGVRIIDDDGHVGAVDNDALGVEDDDVIVRVAATDDDGIYVLIRSQSRTIDESRVVYASFR